MPNETPRWARNKTGQVIHRSDCRHGRYPWNWAGDASDDEMARFVDRNEPVGYRFGACCCGSLASEAAEVVR